MVLSEAVPFLGVTPADWLTEAGGHQRTAGPVVHWLCRRKSNLSPHVELERVGASLSWRVGRGMSRLSVRLSVCLSVWFYCCCSCFSDAL